MAAPNGYEQEASALVECLRDGGVLATRCLTDLRVRISPMDWLTLTSPLIRSFRPEWR